MVRTSQKLLKRAALLALALVAGAQLGGCGGGGSSAPPTGTLKMSITDKLSDSFASVVISVREVRVVPVGKENAPDNDPGLPVVARFATSKVIDVMQLQFVQQALGEVVLPAGTYHQVRLILDQNPNGQGQTPVNYLTLKSAPAVKVPLTTPSGQQSGVKILGTFDVKPGLITAVMLDFDPNTAIVDRGNGDFNLKPTGIRVIQLADVLSQFGSIAGSVSATFKDWSSATVSVKRRGSINDVDPIAAGTVFSNFTSGRWQAPFTAFVPPTTASVSYKVFVSAAGFRNFSTPTFGVLQGQATDVGNLPLTPAP